MRVAVERKEEFTFFVDRLNNSWIVAYLLAFIGLSYFAIYLINGGSVTYDIVNLVLLIVGLLLFGSPSKYMEALVEGVKNVSGIILLFPIFAGIMAVMDKSGLINIISNIFVSFSTQTTLPFWGLISAFIINFVAPTAGGHWVLQGPFMVEAANTLGTPLNLIPMSVQMGGSWNDLVQPFWLVPVIAISRLKLKDIMQYTVISMIWAGIVLTGMFFLWTYIELH